MDRLNYFLAFGRLARRTAVFWGHAATSGITRFDAWASNGAREAAGLSAHSDGQIEGEGSGSGGGPDYFVSSELFEAPFGGQRRYSERLYLMRGLTTCFEPPAPPGASAPPWRQKSAQCASPNRSTRSRPSAPIR